LRHPYFSNSIILELLTSRSSGRRQAAPLI
jgi:hypothetical protein